MTSTASGRSPSSSQIIILSLFCAAVVVSGAALQRHFELGSGLRIAVAFTQAAAVATLIVAIYRHVVGLDEMQQRIMLEALGLAFATVAIVVGGYGFLEQAGLPRLDWGSWGWPALVGVWAVAVLITKWRYR